MKNYKEILIKKLGAQYNELNSTGRRVVNDFDKINHPKTSKDVKVVSLIATLSRWIKESESISLDYDIEVNDGLPCVIHKSEEDFEKFFKIHIA